MHCSIASCVLHIAYCISHVACCVGVRSPLESNEMWNTANTWTNSVFDVFLKSSRSSVRKFENPSEVTFETLYKLQSIGTY